MSADLVGRGVSTDTPSMSDRRDSFTLFPVQSSSASTTPMRSPVLSTHPSHSSHALTPERASSSSSITSKSHQEEEKEELFSVRSPAQSEQHLSQQHSRSPSQISMPESISIPLSRDRSATDFSYSSYSSPFATPIKPSTLQQPRMSARKLKYPSPPASDKQPYQQQQQQRQHPFLQTPQQQHHLDQFQQSPSPLPVSSPSHSAFPPLALPALSLNSIFAHLQSSLISTFNTNLHTMDKKFKSLRTQLLSQLTAAVEQSKKDLHEELNETGRRLVGLEEERRKRWEQEEESREKERQGRHHREVEVERDLSAMQQAASAGQNRMETIEELVDQHYTEWLDGQSAFQLEREGWRVEVAQGKREMEAIRGKVDVQDRQIKSMGEKLEQLMKTATAIMNGRGGQSGRDREEKADCNGDSATGMTAPTTLAVAGLNHSSSSVSLLMSRVSAVELQLSNQITHLSTQQSTHSATLLTLKQSVPAALSSTLLSIKTDLTSMREATEIGAGLMRRVIAVEEETGRVGRRMEEEMATMQRKMEFWMEQQQQQQQLLLRQSEMGRVGGERWKGRGGGGAEDEWGESERDRVRVGERREQHLKEREEKLLDRERALSQRGEEEGVMKRLFREVEERSAGMMRRVEREKEERLRREREWESRWSEAEREKERERERERKLRRERAEREEEVDVRWRTRVNELERALNEEKGERERLQWRFNEQSEEMHRINKKISADTDLVAGKTPSSQNGQLLKPATPPVPASGQVAAATNPSAAANIKPPSTAMSTPSPPTPLSTANKSAHPTNPITPTLKPSPSSPSPSPSPPPCPSPSSASVSTANPNTAVPAPSRSSIILSSPTSTATTPSFPVPQSSPTSSTTVAAQGSSASPTTSVSAIPPAASATLESEETRKKREKEEENQKKAEEERRRVEEVKKELLEEERKRKEAELKKKIEEEANKKRVEEEKRKREEQLRKKAEEERSRVMELKDLLLQEERLKKEAELSKTKTAVAIPVFSLPQSPVFTTTPVAAPSPPSNSSASSSLSKVSAQPPSIPTSPASDLELLVSARNLPIDRKRVLLSLSPAQPGHVQTRDLQIGNKAHESPSTLGDGDAERCFSLSPLTLLMPLLTSPASAFSACPLRLSIHEAGATMANNEAVAVSPNRLLATVDCSIGALWQRKGQNVVFTPMSTDKHTLQQMQLRNTHILIKLNKPVAATPPPSTGTVTNAVSGVLASATVPAPSSILPASTSPSSSPPTLRASAASPVSTTINSPISGIGLAPSPTTSNSQPSSPDIQKADVIENQAKQGGDNPSPNAAAPLSSSRLGISRTLSNLRDQIDSDSSSEDEEEHPTRNTQQPKQSRPPQELPHQQQQPAAHQASASPLPIAGQSLALAKKAPALSALFSARVQPSTSVRSSNLPTPLAAHSAPIQSLLSGSESVGIADGKGKSVVSKDEEEPDEKKGNVVSVSREIGGEEEDEVEIDLSIDASSAEDDDDFDA